jgi:hypothetical protein
MAGKGEREEHQSNTFFDSDHRRMKTSVILE